MSERTYEQFVAEKERTCAPVGFEPGELSPLLFPFQADIVRWACRRGRAALFSDCGTGKAFMSLEWARQVVRHTQGDVLILAPLAVAQQTVREGAKFGIEAHYCREQGQVQPGISITNYEMLGKFDPSKFVGVVPDECFAAGTPIDTPTGRKHIDTIRVGDSILNASGIDIVSDVHRREVPYAVRVRFAGQEIIASPNHPWFTQRGWVGSMDLRPGDSVMETGAAVRLVRGDRHTSHLAGGPATVLRSILLSEMANAATGDCGESTFAGGSRKEGAGKIEMAPIWSAVSDGRIGAHTDTKSVTASRGEGENLPHIESHAPCTFRAWGQRDWINVASTDLVGCSRRELEGGISYITGPADCGLSVQLQARLGASREKARRRGGWILAREPSTTGREERREAGFARVDGIEVLEPGHPDLEYHRAADGKFYFYDLGGTRHPSFSVGGCLVHNSSILKSMDGKTRTALIEAFAATPYRLACTATPAPNDFMELGNHAEFLGVMTRPEMLAMYFVHDGGSTQDWRLKGHAEAAFWRWICEWAVMVRRPSDLGYSDAGFILPPLEMHEHVVAVDHADAQREGFLFAQEARTLGEQRAARRVSLDARVAKCAEIVNASTEQFLVWCELNAEGDALTSAIPGAVQVAGADSMEEKEERLAAFLDGRTRVIVSKPSIFGYGINIQCARNMAFVGLSHSYEQYYQTVRREWRFGQTRTVHCHIITAETEGRIVANLQRKEADATRMAAAMVANMREIQRGNVQGTERQVTDYKPQRPMALPVWLRSGTA